MQIGNDIYLHYMKCESCCVIFQATSSAHKLWRQKVVKESKNRMNLIRRREPSKVVKTIVKGVKIFLQIFEIFREVYFMDLNMYFVVVVVHDTIKWEMV